MSLFPQTKQEKVAKQAPLWRGGVLGTYLVDNHFEGCRSSKKIETEDKKMTEWARAIQIRGQSRRKKKKEAWLVIRRAKGGAKKACEVFVLFVWPAWPRWGCAARLCWA